LMNGTMKRLSYANEIGLQIFMAISTLFDAEPNMVTTILSHIGREGCIALDEAINVKVAGCIREIIRPYAPSHVPTPRTETCPVDVDLLDLWRVASKDPDSCPPLWLAQGAPAGIEIPIPDKGIFPLYDPELDRTEIHAAELETQAEFINYPGIEQDEDVAGELKRLVEPTNKYALVFDSWEEVCAYLKSQPILSKIGAIKKMRNGKLKVRMVVDSKQSKVSRATRKFERTLLPRILDAVSDAMSLSALLREGVEIEYMVADFRDAFYIVPNSPGERRYFVVRFRGRYYIMLRTTQGSRGAPLTWARTVALVMRLTQSVTGTTNCLISTYVDDPLVIMVGTQAERNRMAATVLAIWSALRLPLALDKAAK
jgi:hypothetical protein